MTNVVVYVEQNENISTRLILARSFSNRQFAMTSLQGIIMAFGVVKVIISMFPVHLKADFYFPL